jgi:mono/diheme cytochrome c family protein
MNWSGGILHIHRRMPQPIHQAPLIAALVATALSAYARDGGIAAGHSFARAACSACHVVDAEQRPTRRIYIGPSFRNIANTPDTTAIALHVFLTTSHPKVPNPVVTSEQMADVIAYILSLRSEP